MNIAILSFGFSDTVIPLYKNIRRTHNKIDLFLCYSLNRKKDSILDFSKMNIATGFLNETEVKEILTDSLTDYIGDISKIKFFILYNQKLRSIRNLFLSLKLVRHLKKYDIIHINGTSGVLPFFILLLKREKTFITIHDIIPHSGVKSRFGFATKIVNYICKAGYPVNVLNRFDYNYCIEKYPSNSSKFTYIPFGVLDVFMSFTPKKMINSDILFFGRIEEYKGLKYFVNSVSILRKTGNKIVAIIAGSGDIAPELRQQIKENDIILINKHLSNTELTGLLIGTKVVICPYTDTTQSGVVMTSFSLGKPVIASAIGSFKDMIINGYNGFLFEPGNSEDLADQIRKAISPDTLKILENGVEDFTNNSSEYAWEKIAENYLKFYKNNQ